MIVEWFFKNFTELSFADCLLVVLPNICWCWHPFGSSGFKYNSFYSHFLMLIVLGICNCLISLTFSNFDDSKFKYSCRIQMAPFSDEYLFVEIANKVCIWFIVFECIDVWMLIFFVYHCHSVLSDLNLLYRLSFGSNKTILGLIWHHYMDLHSRVIFRRSFLFLFFQK